MTFQLLHRRENPWRHADCDGGSSSVLAALFRFHQPWSRAELAREGEAILYVFHVVAMPPGPEMALPFGEMETAARTRLERLVRQKIKGKARYQVEVMMGDPGVEILQVAKRRGANLIVIATHGRKGLRRLVLGSVAEHVIREASCPVLTVKPKRLFAKSSMRGPEKKRRAPAIVPS